MGDTPACVKELTLGGAAIGEYTVVHADAPSATLANAAAEFVKYIELATGVRLVLLTESECRNGGLDTCGKLIVIGRTGLATERVRAAEAQLYNNGIAILFDAGRLYLTGHRDAGALYAVYTFLEECVGWRFYSSTFELVKPAERIDVPATLEILFSPKLFSRDTYWYDTFGAGISAKLKLNGGNRHDLTGYGEQVRYAGPFVHSLPALAGTSHAPNVQPCLTDPEVYERVRTNVRKYLAENPGARIVSVSQNDSYADGLGCQCENCRRLDDREGTPMGSLLTFVNRIADDIKDDYPDVYVDTLAYRYTRKAPKHLRPAPNVIIRLCSIECCFSHALESGCERNREFMNDLDEWSRICNNLFIWDYTTDFLYYINPFPNLKVLYDNIRCFVSRHAIGLFEQGNGQSVSGEFGELRAYLIAKLMWDPDMSRGQYYACMDDFLEGYYGAGWRSIREYIDLTSELAAGGHMGIYYPIDRILGVENKSAETRALIAKFTQLWDNALAQADALHRGNVEKSSLQVRYAALCLDWDDTNSPAEKAELGTLIRKHGIAFYREGVRMPEVPELNCPPERW